jgi:hypothetical protein
MPNITNIPAPRVSFIDDRTGLISREWYRFLLNLFTRVENSSDILDDVQQGPEPYDQSGNFAATAQEAELAAYQPFVPSQPTRAAVAPNTLTVGASPYTYTNDTGAPVDVMVSGGGISKMQFTRNGSSFYSTGSFYGMFTLSPWDAVKVWYVAAPTMVVIPR